MPKPSMESASYIYTTDGIHFEGPLSWPALLDLYQRQIIHDNTKIRDADDAVAPWMNLSTLVTPERVVEEERKSHRGSIFFGAAFYLIAVAALCLINTYEQRIRVSEPDRYEEARLIVKEAQFAPAVIFDSHSYRVRAKSAIALAAIQTADRQLLDRTKPVIVGDLIAPNRSWSVNKQITLDADRVLPVKVKSLDSLKKLAPTGSSLRLLVRFDHDVLHDYLVLRTGWKAEEKASLDKQFLQYASFFVLGLLVTAICYWFHERQYSRSSAG